jgi:uncharacterized membrane protein (GlpM family)
MSDVDIASLSGMLVTFASMICYLIYLFTNDNNPIERQAIRLAILAGVASVAAVVGTVVAIYYFVSEVISAFLWFPSIALAGIAVWHASKITYRLMGGGRSSEDDPSQNAEASS